MNEVVSFFLSLFLTHSGEGLFGTKVRNLEKVRSSEWIVNTCIRLFERACSQHYSGQRNAGGGAHRHMQATQLPLPPTKMCGFTPLHSDLGGRSRVEKDIYCGLLEIHCDYHGWARRVACSRQAGQLRRHLADSRIPCPSNIRYM